MRRSFLSSRSTFVTLSAVSLTLGLVAACGDSSSSSGTASGSGGESSSSSNGSTSSSGSSSGMASSSSGSTSSSSGSSSGNPGTGGIFKAPNAWTKDVSKLPKNAESDAITGWLAQNGGWGNGNKFQMDFSIEVLTADASTPLRDFTPTGDFFSPDCENVPMPVPAVGAIEGEQGYACVGDGDCHLIVIHEPTDTLYEMWRANITGPSTWDPLESTCRHASLSIL